MPNTPSARKAARKIARRTEINKGRRSEMRSFVRKVEEAIASGNRSVALAALREAEPVIMRSAQKGLVHSNTASRKVSRLSPQGRQARQLIRRRRLEDDFGAHSSTIAQHKTTGVALPQIAFDDQRLLGMSHSCLKSVT